jgi:hypothetical protein
MHRREFLILSIGTVAGASFGTAPKSVELRRPDDSSSVHFERKHELEVRKVEQITRELRARNRQLELAHKSLTVELELAGLTSHVLPYRGRS